MRITSVGTSVVSGSVNSVLFLFDSSGSFDKGNNPNSENDGVPAQVNHGARIKLNVE